MSANFTSQHALIIGSMIIGLVFGYAATSKLFDVPAFIAGIRAYNLIPHKLAPLGASLLIGGEVMIALAHFSSIGLALAAPCTVAFLLASFVIMAYMLNKGEKRPCLCFGANRDDLIDIYALARIALLLTVEVALYVSVEIDGSTWILDKRTLQNSIASLAVAASLTMLAGWLLNVPKFVRAWHVVTS